MDPWQGRRRLRPGSAKPLTSSRFTKQAEPRGKGQHRPDDPIRGHPSEQAGRQGPRLDSRALPDLLKNDDGIAALVLRPSHKHPCIEGWPPAMFEALSAPLQQLDMFSEEQDDLAAALFADAYPVESDKEGRIIVPES